MLTVEMFPGASPPGLGAPVPVAIGSPSLRVLLEIMRPEVNLAVWQRAAPLPAALLAPLVAAAPFRTLAEASPADAEAALATDLPVRCPPALLRDIRHLADLFAVLTGQEAVRLRLEGMVHDACRRFHADAVGLRLLCTYHGQGTEWLPGSAERAMDHQPNRLPAHAVALLKGDGWPGNAGHGCVHRSPPVSHLASGRRTRLLLCIDEPGRFPLEPCGPRRSPP